MTPKKKKRSRKPKNNPDSEIKNLILFSSGISSWAAAKRKANQEGTEGMILLFADTLIEDEDNYRFLDEAAKNIGAPLVKISDGRDPWEVFQDRRMIGNSKVDPCSAHLKRKLLDRWRGEHCSLEKTTMTLGISWDESHRFDRVKKICHPWKYSAPLCEKPWLSKADTLKWAREEELEPPRMYRMGFAHANCGGFCVKAGHATFKLLLENFPERYREHEEKELALMADLDNGYSILRDRRGGVTKAMTMREFRLRLEKDKDDYELDFGGCQCGIPDGELLE